MCDIKSKIALAKESIILIDDYVDESTLEILESKQDNVEVFVYSKNRLMFKMRNIKRRKCFRAGFHFSETKRFKNRFILIDNKFLFLLSRPIRCNGRRSFWFIQMFDIDYISKLRQHIRECEGETNAQYRHF